MVRKIDVLSTALKYAKMGWSVFPVHSVIEGRCTCGRLTCKHSGKHPKTKNGVKDATKDLSVIKEWFTKWPNSNIGIATGRPSGFIALDFDGEEGERSLNELQSVYGGLPVTVAQLTGGGGRHILFKHPGGVIKNKVKLAPGVDIRGDGGYILVSPSLHVSGCRYKWETSLNPVETPLADLPATWLKFVSGDKTGSQREYLKVEGKIPEGSRNDTLFRLACSLREKGLTESAILAALREVNEKQCIPPLDEEELIRTFNSAMGYPPGELRVTQSAKADFAQTSAEIICLDDVEEEEVEWLWYPYIPLGKITLIQGDPGDGKTTVVLNLAADISTGRALPGVEPADPGNVIYQTAEDGLADTIKPRLVAANADCKRIFVIDESKKGLSLLDSRIEEAMEKIRPRLFIIDPLQAYLGGDVDMHRANEVRPILKRVGALAEKYNCAVILIMHLSKASQNRSLYRGLGSIDIPAAARSVLLVGKNPNNPKERAVAHIKSSLTQNGKSLAFTITDFGIQWLGESPLTADDMLGAYKLEKSDEKSKIDEAVELIKTTIDENQETTASDVFKAGKEIGISRRTIERARDRMRKNGELIIEKQGFGSEGKWVWRLANLLE